METLAGVRLTREAAQRLRRGRAGRVHSAFARTVNVVLDGLGEAGWLSLHGPGPIPSPFGIACARAPVTADLAGVAVLIERDALIVGRVLRLRMDGARVCGGALPSPAPLPPVVACLARALGAGRGGLLPVTASVLAGTPPPADPLGHLAAPVLAVLLVATAARDASACVAAARGLLGLGPGLTPAGDDCLAGWLAGLRAAGARGRGLAETAGPGLLGAARERTGPLSRAFLAAAAVGAVAEPVRRFVAAPDAARLQGLLGLGATSGADLLAGYLLARAALAPHSRSLPGREEG